MFRTAISLLFVASASAFSNQAFIATRSAAKLESSLNDFSDVKESYSGPNLMVGSPDDSASMMPSGAPSVNADKAGRLAFADFIDEAVDLPPQTYQKRVWKTAVFWSEINLYGHTIGTKQAAEAVEG